MLCKGVKRNFLFGERLEVIRDRSIYRLLYAFGKLKNSPTAARHRAVVARILGMVGMVIRGKKLAVISVRIDYRPQTLQGYRSEAHFCKRAVASRIFCLWGGSEAPHGKPPYFLAGFI